MVPNAASAATTPPHSALSRSMVSDGVVPAARAVVVVDSAFRYSGPPSRSAPYSSTATATQNVTG